ncbi:MAG: ArnT family glycosyltransferase [Candidatus Woesearchaeota archaeon]
MNKKMNKKIILLFVSLIVFFTISCLCTYNVVYKFNYETNAVYAPDFFQTNLFSKQLLNNETLKINEPFNNNYFPMFGARSMRISPEGELVPGIMVGQIIIFTIFEAIYENITFLINPLFAVLSLILIFVITKKIFNNEITALIATYLTMIFPPFLNYSIIPYNNIISVFFTLIIFNSMLNLKKLKNNNHLIIAFFLIACLLFIRYPDAAIIFFSVVVYLIFLIYTKKLFISMKTIFFATISFLIPTITFMFVNLILYGKLFIFGNLNSISLIFSDSTRTKILGLIFFDGLKTLNHNIIYSFILPLIPFIFLILLSIKDNFNKYKHFLLLISSSFFVCNILYFGSSWTGSSDLIVNLAPLSRYLLILYLPILIISSIGFKYIKQILSIILIFILVSSSIIFTVNSSYGLIDHYNSMNEYYDKQQKFTSEIPLNSIVFTSYNDKYIYPYRKTAIYSYLPKNNSVSITTNVMIKLINDGLNVYFINEDWHINKFYNKKNYELELNKYNYSMIKTKNEIIYKIIKNET